MVMVNDTNISKRKPRASEKEEPLEQGLGP